MPTYLTIDQIAERLHTPRATVAYWIAIGKLPSFRPGRHRLVRESDLLAFVEGASTDAQRAERVKRARRAAKVGAL